MERAKRSLPADVLEERFQECSKREGVVRTTSVGALGVDLRTNTKHSGTKEKARRKVRCEILAHQEKSNLPENFNEDWCEKAVGNGFGSRESVARTSRWHRAHRKAEVEEANGSSRKEGVSLSLFMDVNNVEVEEELSTMPTLSWAEGVWLGRW